MSMDAELSKLASDFFRLLGKYRALQARTSKARYAADRALEAFRDAERKKARSK